MTKKLHLAIIWSAIIAVLLGGAFVIIERSGPAGAPVTSSGYFH